MTAEETALRETSRGPAATTPDAPMAPGTVNVTPIEASVETSIDSFQGGRFHLVQPKGQGFRAGLDALLLAASLPADRAGAAVDLGSGAGAVGFAVLARCPALTMTLVENNPLMARLAAQSMALAENAAWAPRLALVEADVLGRRAAREAAGLGDGAFATVVTNPPFHPAGGRVSPDPLRHAARAVTDADFLARWIRSGAALLAPGGLFAMIARPDSLGEILGAAERRLGDVRILPIYANADSPAKRILVHARKGSRAPLLLLPGLVLHDRDSGLTVMGKAIGAGDAAIDLGLH